jgi:uncharacterized protein YjbJ (UPF0337 family)
MNKDQVEGKLKDVAGRVERQVGEWTGDEEKQGRGAIKQVEGKVQKAWGDVKDAEKKASDRAHTEEPAQDESSAQAEEKKGETRRKVS